jgi:hypothetical protein
MIHILFYNNFIPATESTYQRTEKRIYSLIHIEEWVDLDQEYFLWSEHMPSKSPTHPKIDSFFKYLEDKYGARKIEHYGYFNLW